VLALAHRSLAHHHCPARARGQEVSAVEAVIARLRNVTPRARGGYRASCPTELHEHGDRSRGLHIGEGDDGRALLWCAAGCSAPDIVAAIGLSASDLFERQTTNLEHGRHLRPRVAARDLLELIDHEALTVGMIALAIRNSQQVTDEDWQRLATAAARIGRARDHARGH
jgi:hypothetical protein